MELNIALKMQFCDRVSLAGAATKSAEDATTGRHVRVQISAARQIRSEFRRALSWRDDCSSRH